MSRISRTIDRLLLTTQPVDYVQFRHRKARYAIFFVFAELVCLLFAPLLKDALGTLAAAGIAFLPVAVHPLLLWRLRRFPVVDFAGQPLRHTDFEGGTGTGAGQVLFDGIEGVCRVVAFIFSFAFEFLEAISVPVIL